MADLYAGHLSGWGTEPWCHACQSRTVTWHCANRGCRRVDCLKCMAVTVCTGGKLSVILTEALSNLRADLSRDTEKEQVD